MATQQECDRCGVLESYVYPSLVIFVIPVVSLLFFLPSAARESASGDVPAFEYWMVRLSQFCLLISVGVFIMMGAVALVARWSRRALHIGLSVGWQVLRVFSVLQIAAQSCLVVGFSYWIAANWLDVWGLPLLGMACMLALYAPIMVLSATVKSVDDKLQVEGAVLDRHTAMAFWDDLTRLSTAIDTAAPDQIIVGIDDNFFVTEQPLVVNDATYTGRSLYVSLSLLKHLQEREVAAVLAHELAHFSGNDTLYSRRISPILTRYQVYLEETHDTRVISLFHAALLFRVLLQFSLGAIHRQRELRADRLAAEETSDADVARALLRSVAYSAYRRNVEDDLFSAETAHADLDISQRIEDGFHTFALAFAEKHNLGKATTAHPFDLHPPLEQRLSSLGFQATVDSLKALFADTPDRIWYKKISSAETLERSLWSLYEERFRQSHESVLALHYLPKTEEERAIVEKHYPQIVLATCNSWIVVIDCEKIGFQGWDKPLYYREIERITAETEMGRPRLNFLLKRGRRPAYQLPLSKKAADQQQLFAVLRHYHGRYVAAVEYQKRLRKAARAMDVSNETDEREATDEVRISGSLSDQNNVSTDRAESRSVMASVAFDKLPVVLYGAELILDQVTDFTSWCAHLSFELRYQDTRDLKQLYEISEEIARHARGDWKKLAISLLARSYGIEPRPE